MRIASCLFTLAVLLSGCAGDEPGPADQPASVGEVEPAPAASKPGSTEPALAAPKPGSTDSTRLTVLFTNNVDGEIEPCG